MHAASAAFWMMPRMMPSALSTTPFYLLLLAFVDSCLMQNCLHTSPNSPPKNYLPLSDLTISTFEGTPSAHTPAKNFLNASGASDLCFKKYTHT